jgi:hypothetical protein
MDILTQYLERADEIIGERTPDEQRYDREVLRWLERGKTMRKAISKANEKYPKEALQLDESTLPDLQAHYEYMLNHERIMRKLKRQPR